MKRRLNLKFLLGLLVVIALLGGGVHLVHGFQMDRNAGALLRRAELAEKKGDLEQDEKYLLRYLAYRPDDDEALARYALVVDKRGGSAKAKSKERLRHLMVLDQAIARAKDSNDALRREVRRRAVDLAMTPELARYKEAREHLEKLLKATPDDGELESLFGRCLEAEALAGRPDEVESRHREARGWYEKAVKHAPGSIDAYVRLAGLLRRWFKEPEAADQIMDRMIAGDPKNPRPSKEQAQAFLARARFRSENKLACVADDVAKAWELAPDETDVLMAAGEMARGKNDLETARKLFRRGIELDPKDVRMYQGLAGVEGQANQPEEARKALGQGLAAIPDDNMLQWNLVETLTQMGRSKEAHENIAQFRKKENIVQPAVDFLEARLLLAEGERAEAIRKLEKAQALLASMPGMADLAKQANLLLAQNYEHLGNPDRQLDASRRVLAIDPGSLEARLRQIAALRALGRNDQALDEYRKIDDDPELARRLPTSRLDVARLLLNRNLRRPENEREGHWNEVDQAIAEAAQTMPDSVDLAILRADVLAVRGRLAEARVLLQKARDKQPKLAGPWIALANLAGRQGEPEDVLKVLDQAQEALGDSIDLRLARIGYWSRRGGDGASKALESLTAGLDKLATDVDRDRLEEGLADAYARLGDLPRAEQLWTKVADRRPNDLFPATSLFELALRSSDEAAADRAVERLRQIEGEDGALWRFGRATLLVRQARREGNTKRLEDAQALLATVGKLRPQWSRVPRLKAEIAELQGDQTHALESCLQAIERGDHSPEMIRLAVTMLLARKRAGEADRLVETLLEEAAPTGIPGQLAADMALRHKEPVKAFELATRAVPADSKDARDQIWLGLISLATEHRPEAGTAFHHAVTLAADSPDAWETYVAYLVRTEPKDRPDALKTVKPEDAIAEAQRSLPADRSPLTLARCQAIAGHPEQAEPLYQSALKAKPGDAALLQEIAIFYTRNGQAAKAEESLQKILDKGSVADKTQQARARRQLALGLAAKGGYPNVRAALAQIELNLRDRSDSVEDQRLKAILLGIQPGGQQEAIRIFEELEQHQPASSGEKMLAARLYEATGDWSKARELMVGALASEPENLGYIANFTRGLLTHGQAAEAAPWLARLEQSQPQSPQTIELKARLLAAQSKTTEAIELLRASTREKDKENLLVPFAGLLVELHLPDAAEALYRDLVARSKQPEAVLILAEFLGRRHRSAEALDLCDKAWTTSDPVKVGLVSLEVLMEAEADSTLADRVAARLEEALRKTPDSVQLQFDLANVQIRRKHYPEAEAIFRRIAERNPNAEGPLNNLAWLLAAEGKGTEALAVINKAIDLVGPKSILLDTRAMAHLALGHGDLAIKDLETALVTGRNPEFSLHLASARLMAKDRKGASAALRKAEDAGLDEKRLDPIDRETYRKLIAELPRN